MSSLARTVGFALALAVPAALAAPPRALAACPQLLMNSEFTERVIGPWGLDVPPPATLMSIAVTNDEYKTLDVSVQNVAGTNLTGELFQPVPIKYGERYRVSFYMYTSQTSMTARVAIRSATDPGKTYGLNDAFVVSTNFSNATQSFTFVAPEGDPDAVFSIYFPFAYFGFYRFDSLFVENISAPECTGGSSGGASGNGGAGGTGGATGTGGDSGTGGAIGTGGAASGGRGVTGGATGNGGTNATGGRSAGGISGSGGRVAIGSGGAPASGGITGTAGSGAVGGRTGTATGTGGDASGTGGDGGGLPGTGGASVGDPDAGTPGTACVPGAQIACACPGTTSAHGVQVCNAQGTAYGACTSCPDAGTGATHGGGQGCGCAVGVTDSPTVLATVVVLLGLLRLSRRQRHVPRVS